MNFGICDDDWKVLARFTVPTTVSSNQPVFSTDTLSLHRRASVRGAQRWEISSNVEPLRHGANELFANLVMKGHHTPLNVYIPQNIGVIETLRNDIESGTTLSVQYSAKFNATDGKSTVTLVGNTKNIPAGTFVTFTDTTPNAVQDTKVYMLIRPVTAGNNVAYVYPQLRKTGYVNSGSVMQYTNVKMKCFYDMDTIQGMVYQDGLLMDLGTIKLVEALA